MRIYIAEGLSSSFSASDKKYFKSKLKGYDLFFSKIDKFDNKFSGSKIVFGNIPAKMIEQNSKLEWVQLESTGFSEGDIKTPFGGYKQSGSLSRDNGTEALDQYLQIKTIWFTLK